MKINLFKVLLYDFLIVIIVNVMFYFLLALIFSDSLSVFHGDEFAFMTLAELCGIVFFGFLFVVSFLLPLFYIQKRHIEILSPQELFWRFMPLVALIATVFASFVMMIGNQRDGITGEAWVNIWLIYGLSYTGLVSFVYLVKQNKKQTTEVLREK